MSNDLMKLPYGDPLRVRALAHQLRIACGADAEKVARDMGRDALTVESRNEWVAAADLLASEGTPHA